MYAPVWFKWWDARSVNVQAVRKANSLVFEVMNASALSLQKDSRSLTYWLNVAVNLSLTYKLIIVDLSHSVCTWMRLCSLRLTISFSSNCRSISRIWSRRPAKNNQTGSRRKWLEWFVATHAYPIQLIWARSAYIHIACVYSLTHSLTHHHTRFAACLDYLVGETKTCSPTPSGMVAAVVMNGYAYANKSTYLGKNMTDAVTLKRTNI